GVSMSQWRAVGSDRGENGKNGAGVENGTGLGGAEERRASPSGLHSISTEEHHHGRTAAGRTRAGAGDLEAAFDSTPGMVGRPQRAGRRSGSESVLLVGRI